MAAPTLVAHLAKAHTEGRLEERLTHFATGWRGGADGFHMDDARFAKAL